MLSYKNVSGYIARWFMNLSISMKMFFIYMFIFIIPAITVMAFISVQSSNHRADRYLLDKQRILEQQNANLQVMISQCEGVYQLLQYNDNIADYLTGIYDSTADEVIEYLYDIVPLFNYLQYTNPNINNLIIYKNNKSKVDTERYIISLQGNKVSNGQFYMDLQPQLRGRGMWRFEKEGEGYVFRYYRTISNSNLSKNLGLMQLTVKAENIIGLFEDPDDNVECVYDICNNYYRLRNGQLEQVYDKSDLETSDYLHNELFVENLGLIVKSYRLRRSVTYENTIYIWVYFISMTLILSLIYYVFVASIINRLHKFRRHIRDSGKKELVPFEGDTYYDEIGLLIKVYNEQITRIDRLNEEVINARLKKQIADNYVLRAQIKPHFIYNAMETIRMMASINDDYQVADMAYELGRYIRYNLSKNIDNSFLGDEVENITHYLEIYKTSTMGKIDYVLESGCDIKNVPCPGFVLQPLVENAIHHAITDQHQKLCITIKIQNIGQEYFITISDNGKGIEDNKLAEINNDLASDNIDDLKPESGIGLLNVAQRLRTFSRYSGASLHIESELGKGTDCRIRFRLREDLL